MADINVDVNLPSVITVDITSPTQALATNISIPGPQGPAGQRGAGSNINNLTPDYLYITGKDGIIVSSNNTDIIYVSGNSGYFQSAVNSLTTNLNNTGSNLNTSILSLSGLFTGYTGNLDNNYATDAQLQSTGSNLYTLLTNFSGDLDATYATDLQLYNTGNTLDQKINSLSGYSASIINLGITGSNLNLKINSLSGYSASDINLASTGSALDSKINSLSGYSASAVNLTSTGITLINNLFNTGSNLNTKIDNLSGYVNTQDTFISNNLNTTGSTLDLKINSLSGWSASAANLASTGSTLNSNIISLSGLFTGYTGTLDATFASDIQLANTGSALISLINSLSGTSTGNYVTKSNGQFTNRPTVNGTGVLLSGEAAALPNTIVYTTGDQTITGVKIFKDNVYLQGDTTIENLNLLTSNYYFDGVTIEIVNSSVRVSGDIYVSGNKVLTGVNLSSYATTTNLASTGSTLNNSIISLSGLFTGFTGALDAIFATDLQLYNTGSTLDNKINSLSGVTVLTYGDQTINGLKDFTTRPTVNTTPVLLSGENANGLTVLVKNDEPATLLKGQPVYIYGANGNNILVRKASNTEEAYSSKTLGLLAQDLTSNAQGLVITEGSLEGINTNAGNAGDPIWLGPTGNLIFGLAQKPYAPNHLVYLGVIERKQSNNGKIYVKVQNGFELEELHNVNINHKNVLNDSDILRYNSASGLWFNETLNTGIFQTQINSLSGSSVLLYGNQSIGGVKTFRDNVYINNLFVTGTETVVSTNNFNVQSSYILLNLTVGAVDGGIFFVTGSGLTGINDNGPIIGFDHSTKFKFGISTRNSDLSTLPDIASVQQIEAYSGVANNTFSTIINLASTGSTLDSKINALSGNNYLTTSSASTTYATILNLASTGSTLDTKINNLSGYVTGTNSTFTTNLASTGSTLNTKINNLSGYINSSSSNIVFTTGNQTISGVKTFVENTTFGDSAQGDFLVISGNNFTVYGSGNFTSGLFVNGNTVLTGSSTLYATSVNLASTGSTLNTRIDNLSGYVNSSSSNIVFTTGNQTISGIKTFAQTGSFDTLSITNKKLSSYSYNSTNFIFGNTYINIVNSSNNITGTLPSGITSGINYYVKNLNTGTLLITGSGQRTIDGFSTVNLYRNESLQLLGVNNVGYTGWVTLSADNGVS